MVFSGQYKDGWLTVDSDTLDRADAFEKNTHKFVGRETSPTSPFWMQRTNHYGQKQRDNLEMLKSNYKKTLVNETDKKKTQMKLVGAHKSKESKIKQNTAAITDRK